MYQQSSRMNLEKLCTIQFPNSTPKTGIEAVLCFAIFHGKMAASDINQGAWKA
jgi:hypothetical protein